MFRKTEKHGYTPCLCRFFVFKTRFCSEKLVIMCLLAAGNAGQEIKSLCEVGLISGLIIIRDSNELSSF